MRLILFVLLFSIFQPINAQMDIDWAKSFGSEQYDGLSVMLGLSNGNILAVGIREFSEVVMYEISSEGDVIWNNSISFEEATIGIKDVILAEDGEGYVLVGSYRPTSGKRDFLIIRTDASGNEIWSETYGGSENDSTRGIQQNGNGYIVAGISDSSDGDITDHKGNLDYWVIWIDQNGVLTRAISYGGTEDDQLNSLTLTADNNLLLAGHTFSFSNFGIDSDYWIIKTNLDGDIIWSKSYGGADQESLGSAVEVDNGNFVIAGWSKSNDHDIPMDNHGGFDYFACRIDQAGALLWSKSYGGSDTELFHSLIKAGNNSIYLAGHTESDDGDIANGYHGTQDYWVVQIDDKNGSLIWENNFGGTGQDHFSDLVLLNDELYVGGISYSNNGDIDGDNNGGADIWIVKLINISTNTVRREYEALSISPNPCNDYLELSTELFAGTFEIYSATGSKVHSGNLSNLTNGRINVNEFVPGIYFIEIYDRVLNKNYVDKFIKN